MVDPRDQKSTVARRLEESRLTGGGSAFPENYMAQGMSKEEAQRKADEVRKFAKEGLMPDTGTPRVDSGSAEAPEPPDREPKNPEEAEKENATMRQLLELAQGARNKTRAPGGEDPYREFLSNLEKLRVPLEKGLDPIDPLHLLFNESVEQVVPLVGGQLKVRFRSLTALEYNLIERWILTHRPLRGTPPFLMERLTSLTLMAMSVSSLNKDEGPQVPPVSQHGFNHDLETFEKVYGGTIAERLNWILKRPTALVELLRANFIWFEQRIHRVVSDASYLDHNLKKV